MVYLNVISWNYPGRPEGNHDKSQSGLSVLQTKFEADTSRINKEMFTLMMEAACSSETSAHGSHTADLQVASIAGNITCLDAEALHKAVTSGSKPEADYFLRTDIMVLSNQVVNCAHE